MKNFSILLVLVLILSGCSVGELEQDLLIERDKVTELNNDVAELKTEIDNENELNQSLESSLEGVQEELEALLLEKEELEIMNQNLDNQLLMLEDDVLSLTGPTSGASLLSEALVVMDALKMEDYVTLSSFVDSSDGLSLGPNQYVEIPDTVVLSVADVLTISTSTTLYTWGMQPGSGDDIILTPSDYFDQYVYDEDYELAPMIGQNTVVSFGSLINNISIAFPGTSFVEFYFSGFDPTYAGLDWKSVTLVFEDYAGTWKLKAIVHGAWTP